MINSRIVDALADIFRATNGKKVKDFRKSTLILIPFIHFYENIPSDNPD
jgi:hypothetical protein